MKNNKWLLIAFGVLLVLFIGSKLWDKKPQRSFNSDFLELTVNEIDKVVVTPKPEAGLPFTLTKSSESWEVSDAQISAEASTEAVESMLSSLADLRAKRVVAKSTEKHGDYEVEEASSKKIELYSGDKRIDVVYLGRFDFNQQTRSAKSYIRNSKSDNVYVVDGFLSMTLGQSMDAFRNKTLLRIDQSEIQNVNLEYAGKFYSLHKENAWVDQNNQPLDSTAVELYISSLTQLTGNQIVDNYQTSSDPLAVLSVGSASSNEKLIKLYSDEEYIFVLQSSQNPDTYFATDSTGAYKRSFKDLIDIFNGPDR